MEEKDFLEAINSGDLEKLRKIINNGFDFHNLSLEFYETIHNLITDDKLDILKILFDNNLSITIEMLLYAILNGKIKIVKFLLDSKTDFNLDLALYRALECNQYDIVKLLLDYGANLNKIDSSISCRIAQCGYTELLKLLVNHDFSLDPSTLEKACLGKHSGTVKFLLEYGLDPNIIEDKYDIFYESNSEIFQLLIKYGINFDKLDLINAMCCGDEEIFHLVYDSGEWNQLDIVHYLNRFSIMDKNSNPRIYQFLLRTSSHLIDKELAKEMYLRALVLQRIDLLELLIEYVPFPGDDYYQNCTLKPEVIKFMQSKGFFLQLELIQ